MAKNDCSLAVSGIAKAKDRRSEAVQEGQGHLSAKRQRKPAAIVNPLGLRRQGRVIANVPGNVSGCPAVNLTEGAQHGSESRT